MSHPDPSYDPYDEIARENVEASNHEREYFEKDSLGETTEPEDNLICQHEFVPGLDVCKLCGYVIDYDKEETIPPLV